MKKFITIIAVLVSVFTASASDKRAYMQAMGATLGQMGSAKTPEQMQDVANKFERIAENEKEEWYPNYYVALCYTLIATKSNDGKSVDNSLDKADAFIAKLELQKGVSMDEVEVLKAQSAMMRIAVDGQARFMTFGAKFEEAIAKAKASNPENPRPFVLKGQMIYYTPAQFGGGADKACPEFKQAIEKFSNFKAQSPFSPNWGLDQAKALTANCK